MRIEIVYAVPERSWRIALDLAAGSSVAEAVTAARDANLLPDIDLATLQPAVFGRLVAMDTALREGDRVELLRPLLTDPMANRRRRAAG